MALPLLGHAARIAATYTAKEFAKRQAKKKAKAAAKKKAAAYAKTKKRLADGVKTRTKGIAKRAAEMKKKRVRGETGSVKRPATSAGKAVDKRNVARRKK